MIIEYLKFIKKEIEIIIDVYFRREKLNFEKGKKYAFVMLSATYENLGDIAITLAQIDFLKRNLPQNYQVIEIPVEKTYKVYLNMKKNISKDSFITLIGGGNNGDLYEFIEKKRRFILNKFYKYNIISFPQTVVYNDKPNNIYRNKFVKLCDKCKNLTIIARESKSYERYSKLLKNNRILLAPDIVFSLNYNYKENEREEIASILRNDKEKSLSFNFQEELINYVKNKKIAITEMDTCDIKIEKSREYVLENYLEKLSSKKLAITDRLHGMILCYVTKTPCIVFTNNNCKITSTYETWLKNQNFIKLCDEKDFEEVKRNIDELLVLKNIQQEELAIKYEEIINILNAK